MAESEIINSHGVVSLLTNISILQALEVIDKRWKQDNSLHMHIKLVTDNVMELLEFVLATKYFSYGGEIYRQI